MCIRKSPQELFILATYEKKLYDFFADKLIEFWNDFGLHVEKSCDILLNNRGSWILHYDLTPQAKEAGEILESNPPVVFRGNWDSWLLHPRFASEFEECTDIHGTPANQVEGWKPFRSNGTVNFQQELLQFQQMNVHGFVLLGTAGETNTGYFFDIEHPHFLLTGNLRRSLDSSKNPPDFEAKKASYKKKLRRRKFPIDIPEDYLYDRFEEFTNKIFLPKTMFTDQLEDIMYKRNFPSESVMKEIKFDANHPFLLTNAAGTGAGGDYYTIIEELQEKDTLDFSVPKRKNILVDQLYRAYDYEKKLEDLQGLIFENYQYDDREKFVVGKEHIEELETSYKSIKGNN